MSGRWRSRHWRPEDDTSQQHHHGGGGGRGVEHQNSYDSRSYYGGPASWNGAGGGNNHQDYDHGGQFYRRDDMSYNHHHQQYQQHHDPRYHDNRRPQQQQQQYYNEMPPRNNYNYSNEASDDRRGGRWQRGQNPAHRHHGHTHPQQHEMRSGNGRANNSNPSQHNNRAAPSSKRNNVSSGSNSNHSSNPSNNAWGRQSTSAAPKPSDEPDGNVKAENANTSTRKLMKESSVNNSNAWKKPNPSSSPATGSSVKSEFPSLSSAKESSQHERKPSSDNGDVNMKVEMKEEDNNINIAPASSTLPTASSWGKSHSSLGWGAAKQPPPPSKKKEQGSGEEFPSLSASLDAPSRKQQQPQGTTTADVSLNNEETTKKGGNKKSAASTSLASFLIPQLGDASEKKKGNTTTNKKQPPTKNNVNKAGQNPANGHIDNKKKHPREDPRAPFQHHRHAAITSTTTNSASATTTTTGAPPIKKGRQRLAPRKKKLTTLKKRVLEERLRIWKERNGEESVDPVAGGGAVEADANTSGSHQEQQKNGSEKSTTLLVDNFVNPEEDDLTDDDEHDELVTNLINLAGRVGRVVSVYIPRPSSDNNDEEMGGGESTLDESNHVGLSFVRLATYQDAHAARDILDGMVVGGQKLCTKILYSMELEVCDFEFANKSPATSPSQDNEQQWRRALFKAIVANHTSSSLQEKTSLRKDGGATNASLQPSSESTIVFYNILSVDDYEDEDALEESIEDIKSIAGQYGHVANARGDDAGNVYVTYDTRDIASFAAQKLDGMLLGGVSITVSVESSMSTNRTHQAGSSTVVLDNVLSEDDFEDEDCLNESIEDIRSLAEKYGVVGSLIVDTSNEEEKGKIHVEYTGGIAVAGEAAKQLNGMMFGGRLISATLLSSGTEDTNIMDNNSAAKLVKDDTNVQQEPPQPMFSGDKVIPERFAQCKRVPKVANSGTPRAYASKIADPGAIPLLTEMLGELMRLQQRSKDQKNARSRRRLVMGLREVARGIRAHKVKMVVMANNLDEYGAIDSKLQEILDLAHAEDVPVIFELNKRKLGKAVGKSIKVSVVGVQNVMGAEQQFKQLKKMAGIS